MNFKNFRLNVILRVIFLVITIFLFYYSFATNFFFTPVIVAGVVVFQVASLIRYIDKTNRELSSFLESIRFSEFTRTFKMQDMGSSFAELNNAFNEVMHDFQQVRSEKEEHFHYLQTILQNIDVSIIAYRQDGTIELINKSAKKLFQVSGLRNIQGLSDLSADLVNTLFKIKPGQNELVRVQDDDDFLQLTIYATNFKIKDKVVTLATIQNIQSVLEEQETESWQKLIRVLTHEIMNSITPIASISSTLDSTLKSHRKNDSEIAKINHETILEIEEALTTINKRSKGLLHFVDTYRNLTKIPNPNFEICQVSDIFKNVKLLLHDELSKHKIDFQIYYEPEKLTVTVDEQLIEQVLINLVKNSIQSLKSRKDPVIRLSGFYNKRGHATMQVYDNGVGIIPEVLEKIFIPFFTTKPSGSGIGLALSRQILRLHNGSITAQSVPDKETIFTLTF